MSEHQTPRSSRPGSPDRFAPGGAYSTNLNGTRSVRGTPPIVRRSRSMSLDPSGRGSDFNDRMRYTRDYKLKGGFKGNSRGSSIQGPFTTLEEVFKRLPKNVGFNVELSKFPLCCVESNSPY